MRTYMLYKFLWAAMTKDHKLEGLKQKFIVSHFWRLDIQNQVVDRALLSL
mgnify:CR=1 FL=1